MADYEVNRGMHDVLELKCRGLDSIPEVGRKLFIKTNDMVYFKAALFSLPTTIYQTLTPELRKTYPM